MKYVLTEKSLWNNIYEYVYIKRPCPILMKQMLRRMTSLVMALLVLFSLLPLQSFATEADDIPPATTEETTPGEEGSPDPEESLDPTESIPPETTQQETELLTGLQKEEVKFYLLSGKARSIVDQAVTKVGIQTGETWFDVWYLNKWSGYWAVWGSWWYGWWY